ncbi:hypothetical protein [Bradyrhizobium sp. AZCC 2289]
MATELDRLGFIPFGNDDLAALLQQVMQMVASRLISANLGARV